MADSTLVIKDASGTPRDLATDLSGTTHTPKHISLGPLTNTELRAAAVPVSGPATDAQLRATPLPISGALTDTQLRATAVPVSGPATDAQLRATPIPVSGPITDALLRASAVTVTEANNKELPLTGGTYTLIAGGSATIAFPAGATGVRLFPHSNNVRFRIDAAPAAVVADTLTAGGLAVADQLRVLRAVGTDIRLLNTNGGATTAVDVEFFGV